MPPRKGGLPITASAAGQIGFGAVGVEDGVAAFDGIEGVEDGIAGAAEAVAAHPLDFADPDGDAGKFGGVGVDLDSFDVGGADGGEGALQAHRLGFELDAVLQVLEGIAGPGRESCRSRRRDPAR